MILDIIILILAVLLGALTAFLIQSRESWWKQWRPMIISFGGAFLLGVTVLEIFPSVYKFSGDSATYFAPWILVGFLVQVILETFSGGIEHGHVHTHDHGLSFSKAFTIFLGLSVHSLIEGMPISGMSHEHDAYVLGIFFHKFPAAFALMAYLLATRISKSKAWLFIIVFSLMTPLGTLLGDFLLEFFSLDKLFPVMMALVAGSFLHISTIVLFEVGDSNSHNLSYKKLFMIVAGLSLSLLI